MFREAVVKMVLSHGLFFSLSVYFYNNHGTSASLKEAKSLLHYQLQTKSYMEPCFMMQGGERV